MREQKRHLGSSATGRSAHLGTITPMPNIGPLELAIVLIIALVIFGPKRLPELGRSVGNGMREFRNSISGKNDEEERELQDPPDAPEPVEGEVVTQNRS
jgi:sec-independent protein translocase protein TatA